VTINLGCSRTFLFRVASLAVFLLGAFTSTATHSQVASRRRPRVGLAMNGEGAIGFTQIGVLRWMEEHHIPVDYIAGTSVGGLVGGGYATGMFSFEIRQFVEKIDFTAALFLGDAPYQEKGNWAKSETIKLPGLPELQLAPFMPSKTPDVAVPLLPGIANSYRNLRSFDDLPTPFRCQAADLRTGHLLILNSGSLPEALRVSITLIGASNPVHHGDQILVSGAVVNSIPTDVAREMGADIVVASFTPATTALESSGAQSDFSSPLQQVVRTLDIARMQNESKGLATADVVILPDVKRFSASDFTRLRQLEQQGYDAAEVKAASLQRLALSDSEWEEYVRNREERRIR
jgi:NTE family protein